MAGGIVLGVGNLLNRDEGVGVHALRALEERIGGVEGFDLVDGGVLGLNLLPLVEDCERLLVLDAVDVGAPPGTLVELSGDEIPLLAGVKMSQHQVTLQEVLALASMRGRLPAFLHLVGVQPADLSIGMDLSEVVAAALPTMIERAGSVLDEWRETSDA